MKTKIWFYQTSDKGRIASVKNFWKADFRVLAVHTSELGLGIRCDEGLTLETSAFQIFHGGNSTFINFFDKTKFLNQ